MATKTIRFEPTVVGDEIILDNDARLTSELLWTNGTPSANFAAQTLGFDVSEYKFLGILFHHSTSSTNGTFVIVYNIQGKYQLALDVQAGKILFRNYQVNSNNKLEFADCYTINSYGSGGQASNSSLIPYQIYGLK